MYRILELGCPTVKYFAEIVAANWSYKDLLLELKRCEVGYYDFIKAYTKSSLSVNTLKLLDSVYNERELKELKVNYCYVTYYTLTQYVWIPLKKCLSSILWHYTISKLLRLHHYPRVFC